jgi:hypothetical protein
MLAGARDVVATNVQGSEGRQRWQLLLDEVDRSRTRQGKMEALVRAL